MRCQALMNVRGKGRVRCHLEAARSSRYCVVHRDRWDPFYKPADVWVQRESSLVIFTPISEQAEQWVDQYVDEDRIRWGDGFVAELRYAGDIAMAMVACGLELGEA